MRLAFVEEHRHQLPVNRLCQIMDVSPRGYRAGRARPASWRQRTDMVLLAHIRDQFPPVSRQLRQAQNDRRTDEAWL